MSSSRDLSSSQTPANNDHDSRTGSSESTARPTSRAMNLVAMLTQRGMRPMQRQAAAMALARRAGNQGFQRMMIQRAPDAMTELDKIAEILKNTWVGPFDEAEIGGIWNGFGQGLMPLLAENVYAQELWRQSWDRGAELDDLPEVQRIQKEFEWDVYWLALEYLSKNEKYINEKMETMGVAVEPGKITVKQFPDKLKKVEDFKVIVAEVKKAMDGIKEMRDINVGYDYLAACGGGGYVPVRFSPDRHPTYPPKAGDGWPTWEETNEKYQGIKMVLQMVANQYPAIYALMRDESGEQLQAFLDKESPEEAQLFLGHAMHDVVQKIQETRDMLRTEDLDVLDLLPIHKQLYGGAKPAGGTNDWTKYGMQWAAKDAVKGHEDAEFWISIGLGTLAAAAFVVAEIASGGTATIALIAGLGLGAAQAGMSWEKYDDLSTAANANVRDDLAMVAKEQVDAAKIAAILDTAFFFLDLYSPLRAGAKAVMTGVRGAAKETIEAGVKAGSAQGLKNLSSLSSEEAAEVVAKSITERGIEQTMKQSGKSAEQLVEIVGRDSPAAKLLKTFTEEGALALGTVKDRLANLASFASLAEAEEFVQKAIASHGAGQVLELGGGYKKLTTALGGNSSKAAQQLFEWRKGIYDGLEKHMKEKFAGKLDDLKATGSRDFNSDLDISFLGPNSSEMREEATRWLSGRLGTADPGKISNLLYLDLFTDPRRMHIYDELAAGIRAEVAQKQSTFTRQLVFGKMLKETENNPTARKMVLEQIEAMGLKEADCVFKPLSIEQRGVVAKEIDALHNTLIDAIKSGDSATQKRVALEIAEKQAMINAAEGGGYATGGGVLKFVTEPSKLGIEDIAKYPLLASQQFDAVIDQLPHMLHMTDEFKALAANLAKAESADLASAIKGVAKYGDRMSSITAGALKSKLPSGFEKIAADFESLISRARLGANQPESVLKQLAEDRVKMVSDVERMLAQLEGASTEMLSSLNRAAGLEGTKVNVELIQLMTKGHAELTVLKDAIIRFMADAANYMPAATFGGRVGNAAGKGVYDDD